MFRNRPLKAINDDNETKQRYVGIGLRLSR